MKRYQKLFLPMASLFLALCLLPGTLVIGQGPEKPSKQVAPKITKLAAEYVQREQNASAQVKSTLVTLRGQITEKKYSFIVGYTQALDEKLELLAGTRAPENLPTLAKKQNEVAERLMSVDHGAREEYRKVNPKALPEYRHLPPLAPCVARPAFDWRKSGKVTPVRNQDGCGSCWAFGAIGAYEGNYLIRNVFSNKATLDTSEQHVLNCSGAGSCGGGWHAGVFDYLIKTGTASETDDPYTANDKPCKTGITTPYRAVAWGYVKPDGGIPTVEEMKAALCQHGPLTVAVFVSPLFQAYTGGVFNEMDTSHGINHDITLIGWDDSKHAWLIKNSWGPNWGETGGFGTERGYMWIDYNSNNIGYGAAWVQAQSRFYILPHRYFEVLPDIRPMPGPMKTLPKQQ